MMPRTWAIVPAAGTGKRFGASIPKQYLMLNGRPVLWHTLSRLHASDLLDQIVVVLSPEDPHFAQYDWHLLPKLQALKCGGEERAHSVLHGLQAIQEQAGEEDWILVHDAARPLISAELIQQLMTALQDDPIGGLLAQPVADTLKKADAVGRVSQTIARAQMWQAQTPQMFRYAKLLTALQQAILHTPTDEAAAMEAMGWQPKLVAADAPNFKITYPHDLQLAAAIMASHSQRESHTNENRPRL